MGREQVEYGVEDMRVLSLEAPALATGAALSPMRYLLRQMKSMGGAFNMA